MPQYQPANISQKLYSAPGGILILDTLEGGLKERRTIREGALVTNSNDKDIHDSFLVLLPHNL